MSSDIFEKLFFQTVWFFPLVNFLNSFVLTINIKDLDTSQKII